MNRGQVVFAATVVLAVVFSIEGTLRIARIDFHVLRFAVWGYPPWAVWAVSLGQILGAGLLLWPRTFAAGAWLLAAICAGFVVTHLSSGDGTVVFTPLALLAGLGGLAAMRRVQEG